MASQRGTFKFAVGDWVVISDATLSNRRVGTISGRYGRYDNIPREHDIVVATTPWGDLMYTVELDDGEKPAQLIQEESRLTLLADIPTLALKHLRPPQGQ